MSLKTNQCRYLGTRDSAGIFNAMREARKNKPSASSHLKKGPRSLGTEVNMSKLFCMLTLSLSDSHRGRLKSAILPEKARTAEL